MEAVFRTKLNALVRKKIMKLGLPEQNPLSWIRYSPHATSHSLASACEQPLEVVQVHVLLISSVLSSAHSIVV